MPFGVDDALLAYAGSNILGNIFGGRAGSRAARDQANATRQGIDQTRQMFDQVMANLQPYLDTGNTAINALLPNLGFNQVTSPQSRNPEYDRLKQLVKTQYDLFLQKHPTGQVGGHAKDIARRSGKPGNLGSEEYKQYLDSLKQLQDTPEFLGGDTSWQYQGNPFPDFNAPTSADVANSDSYKFRLKQGEQAIGRSAAAKGMLGSGNFATALTDYAQGLASTEYGNEFQRRLQAHQQNIGQTVNYLNQLQNLVGTGASAAGMAGQFSGQASGQLNNLIQSLGQSKAAQDLAWGNAGQNSFDTLSTMFFLNGLGTKAPTTYGTPGSGSTSMLGNGSNSSIFGFGNGNGLNLNIGY